MSLLSEVKPEAPSGKFLLRVPVSIHKQMIDRAKQEKVSLNTLAITLIAQGLGVRDDR